MLALTAAACGGEGDAAPDAVSASQMAEVRELAFEANQSADEAKRVANEALAAVAGEGPAHGDPAAEPSAVAEQSAAGHDAGDAGDAGDADDAGEPPHWSYEGANGPEAWASLTEDFAVCEAGLEQSPIDLMDRTVTIGLDDLELSWGPTELTMVDNGHTIQANVSPGNTTTIDGVVYNLLQFHFHKPSEHQAAETVFPMELHFVHKSTAGHLAVLGVLLTVGDANPAYDTLWAAPTDRSEATVTDFELATLLPSDLRTHRYAGSLTTPPCSEGVAWNVVITPATISQEQVDAFAYDGNARPVQDLGDRVVVGDKS